MQKKLRPNHDSNSGGMAAVTVTVFNGDEGDNIYPRDCRAASCQGRLMVQSYLHTPCNPDVHHH